ncbi:hypothetical protein KP509_26G044900 [Ceratopteris richardii]|uniref:Uncharacterized protein n=1 Tax=Ceratopteris richardii TaxID=49495 RepID=A0A8T2RN28_CERRI|nr:hypothetical protein KP509_26G044900 [Ceratopteris richardii]
MTSERASPWFSILLVSNFVDKKYEFVVPSRACLKEFIPPSCTRDGLNVSLYKCTQSSPHNILNMIIKQILRIAILLQIQHFLVSIYYILQQECSPLSILNPRNCPQWRSITCQIPKDA